MTDPNFDHCFKSLWSALVENFKTNSILIVYSDNWCNSASNEWKNSWWCFHASGSTNIWPFHPRASGGDRCCWNLVDKTKGPVLYQFYIILHLWTDIPVGSNFDVKPIPNWNFFIWLNTTTIFDINPFSCTSLFLYPQKTSNHLVSWYFQGVSEEFSGMRWLNFSSDVVSVYNLHVCILKVLVFPQVTAASIARIIWWNGRY